MIMLIETKAAVILFWEDFLIKEVSKNESSSGPLENLFG